jgi:hypothetical protein
VDLGLGIWAFWETRCWRLGKEELKIKANFMPLGLTSLLKLGDSDVDVWTATLSSEQYVIACLFLISFLS